MSNETVQSEIFSYVAFSTVAWLETGRLPVRISVTTAEFCQQNNVLRGRWSLSIQIIQGDSTLVCIASHTRQLVPGDLGDKIQTVSTQTSKMKDGFGKTFDMNNYQARQSNRV